MDITSARRILFALFLGGAGGYLFYLARLPLPWMLGAMTATTVASMSGAQISVPPLLRSLMLVVLGVLLGSSFTPDAMNRLGEWVLTLLGLGVYVAVAGWMSYRFLRRFGGYDEITSFFAGMPGGLNEMVVVGSAMGGDERSISLIHAVRILITVTGIVFWFRLAEGYTSTAPAAMIHLTDVPARDLLILAGTGVIGTVAARVLRLPAPFMFGPMLVSAAIHLGGFTASRPPVEVAAAAQIVIGSALGCRFSGVPFGFIGRTSWRGVFTTLILLSTAVLAAVVLSMATGIPGHVILLAFAPGGLAEMTLVALSLNVDVSFVALHHLARVIMVFTVAPLVFRSLFPRSRRFPPKPPAADGH